MKNKEIEIVLNYLKDEKWDCYPADLISYKTLLKEERDILLLYIEQLNLENKFAKEYEKSYREIYKKYEQLENNRDKAIEYLNTYAGYDNNFCLDYHEINSLIDILKGGSDE